jgi:type I restriction enzyme S subunit
VTSSPTVALKEVADFTRGLTYTKSDEVDFSSNIVLRANNVDLNSGTILYEDLKYLRDSFVIPSDKKVQSGSLIICTASGSKSHLGKVALIPDSIDMAFGGFMGMLRPKDVLDGRFLYYALRSPAYFDFISQVTDGANINNLKFSDLGLFEFPLPPLDEQKRIVAKLDEAMGEAETLSRAAQMKSNSLEELEMALVEKYLGSREDGVHVELGSLGKWITGSTPPTTDKSCFDGEVPFLTPGDIGRVGKLVQTKRTLTERGEAKSRRVEAPSVNVVCIGATLGKVSWSDFSITSNQQITSLEPDLSKVDPEYLTWRLASPSMQELLWDSSSTNTVPLLNKSSLERISVSLPPVTFQKKQMVLLNTHLQALRDLESNLEGTNSSIDLFRSSLLTSAFAGEL